VRLGVGAALVAGELVPGDVEIADDRVAAVGLSVRPGAEGVAVPGFVDLQVNGFGGVEFRHAAAEDYATAAAALAAHGAVAVQPTFFSSTPDEYVAALDVLAGVRSGPLPSGCRFLPAHLEGPFLSPAWVGAHRPADLRAPDPALLERLLDSGPVGMVTLAPELPGALELVGALVRRGVVASIGHSDATAAQTRVAVDAGVRHLTHCWNAQRRFSPRDPGPVGVALTDRRCTVGLIPDLVHTAVETVIVTFAAAVGRVAVTTDAIPPAGAGLTAWTEHGRRVTVTDGAARLDDGTLAGSVATPEVLLGNLVDLGVSLAVAVDALGGVQRRLLSLPEVALRPGDPADITVLDDDHRVRRTVVAGEVVHPV
jgi:N-acetylglucosamine-6-phosphate deacetylase